MNITVSVHANRGTLVNMLTMLRKQGVPFVQNKSCADVLTRSSKAIIERLQRTGIYGFGGQSADKEALWVVMRDRDLAMVRLMCPPNSIYPMMSLR